MQRQNAARLGPRPWRREGLRVTPTDRAAIAAMSTAELLAILKRALAWPPVRPAAIAYLAAVEDELSVRNLTLAP
jgi:hypothetical protein